MSKCRFAMYLVSSFSKHGETPRYERLFLGPPLVRPIMQSSIERRLNKVVISCMPFYQLHIHIFHFRSVGLAGDIESCRFVCAIYPECRSIDFVKDKYCILNLLHNDGLLATRLQNENQVKPEICRTIGSGKQKFRNIIRRLMSHYFFQN